MITPRLPLPSKSVIDEADAYLHAALLIEPSIPSNQNIMRPACVLAALSIEIYLKSFNAQYTYETRKDRKHRERKTNHPAPGPAGKNESLWNAGISAEEKHNLTELFLLIDKELRQNILSAWNRIAPSQNLESLLNRYADFFITGRYGYELDSEPLLRTELLRLAEKVSLVCHQLVPQPEQI